ncbi:MAG: NAD(P)/FAD-dependent oxidoreductase [Gammaproteobacteria bacterium]
MSKTVMVLGGGIGGVVAATRLAQGLAGEHRVVLVDRETDHLFQPSLLWLMAGWRTPGQIARPLARVARRGIEVVHGAVERIDPARRAVTVNGRERSADYLVIALGAELAPETVPGLAQGGHNLYTLAGAAALRDALAGFHRGRIALLVSAMPYKCPAAPYEAAMLIEYHCRRRGARDAVSIDLYTPEPGPMPVAGPEVSKQVRQMVEGKGIGMHTEHAVRRVDPAARRIEFANGASADFDLLVYIPPHRAPPPVRDAGLTGPSGWVAVDRATLATSFPGVYAIGDVTGIPLAVGKPLPKAGVFAHGHAEVVARNLAAEIKGERASARYTGDGECFVETGDGRAGYGSGNFYAEPAPQVALKPPGRLLHLGKVLYEKFWLYRWF